MSEEITKEIKKTRVSRRRRRKSEEQVVVIAGFILVLLIYIVAGFFACEIPIVPICMMALLEVIVAKCFHELPILIHILVAFSEIVVGAYVGQILFAVLAAVLYFVSVVVLCYRRRSQ